MLEPSNTNKPWLTWPRLAGGLAALSGLSGFFFHTSFHPQLLGKYSLKYLGFLVCLTLLTGYVFALWLKIGPWLARRSPGVKIRIAWVVLTLGLVGLLLAHWRQDGRRSQTRKEMHTVLGRSPPVLPASLSAEKARDELRVFCLGGSTSQAYPRFLRELIEADPDLKDRVVVVSQAMEWWTSQQSVVNYLINLRPLKPDLVFFMHAVNDYSRQFPEAVGRNHALTYFEGEWILDPRSVSWHAPPYREDYGHYLGPWRNRLLPSTVERDAYRRTRTLFARYWFSDFRTDVRFTSNQALPGLPVFERMLALLEEVCREDETELVLLTQPFTTSKRYFRSIWLSDAEGRILQDADFERGMNRYNETTRHFARRRDLTCIDLEQTHQDHPEWFEDEVHQITRGLKQTARAVYDRIARRR